MDGMKNITQRQWAIAVAIFISTGVLGMVLITFAPLLIVAWPILLALFILQSIFEGVLVGVYRVLIWPFRRNQPNPQPKDSVETSPQPWPIRYAALAGFSSGVALTWIMTGEQIKEYF